MATEIPDGELFADLQISFTEVVLIDILEERSQLSKEDFSLQNRRSTNNSIIRKIKNIMKERFSLEDINKFLEKGFPRKINF